jgi:lysyl-tRNA synthetase class 1
MKPLTPHWADQAAARVAAACGNKESYTVASGITPSGTVHIGNFREVITVDLVARALRSLGKKVRFIYSWDDFDTLRKVPKNLPDQAMLTENLRRPISHVPDPYGEDKSYAAHNIRVFEEELTKVGIDPEFLYQSERYGAGLYAEQIKVALEKRDVIRKILDEFRAEPLEESWLPTTIYCSQCWRDQLDYERYLGDYSYGYKCSSCGHEEVVDIRQTAHLKLNWRTDWPMRWNYEAVDFEPGGKDHSSDGGSYDTGKRIVKEVWGREAPQYLQYDFVLIKGGTGKMSSSKGELITLADAMAVYEPQMVRWIFANQRPNTDFSIAFDTDVIKVYDEFDRAEQFVLQPMPVDSPGKWPVMRRAYELSCLTVEVPLKAPYRAPFRELTGRLQLCDGDIERTWEAYYRDKAVSAEEKLAFVSRSERAWTWVKEHAPDEFRYSIHSAPVAITLSEQQKAAVLALRGLLQKLDLNAIEVKDLNQRLYDDIIHTTGCDGKEFFTAVYQKVIGRDQGPRLPGFLKELGNDRVLRLLADV